MTSHATTLVAGQQSDPAVDAYLDALLALPPAAPPAPATAASPETNAIAQEAASDLEPISAPATEQEAEAEAESAAKGEPELQAGPILQTESELEPELEPQAELETAPDIAPQTDSPSLPGVETGDGQASDPTPAPLPVAHLAGFGPESSRSNPFGLPEGASRPAPAPAGQRWLRVAIGDDRYAVELLQVQEVVRLAPLIAVRGAVPSLLGVMNLRGRVVPVHDFGRWLRRAPVVTDDRSRIVVLEHHDELTGLLVTAVTDVVTLTEAQIEPPAPGLRDRIGLGIARTPGAPPTVLLDVRVIFE